MQLFSQINEWQAHAAALHIRLPIIWQGQEGHLLAATKSWLSSLNAKTVYWLGNDAPAVATTIGDGKNYQLLGTECDILVINGFSGFSADNVAATAGCLKAGGVWLILCPAFAEWQQRPNPAHTNLLPYPLQPQQHQGQFLLFWLQHIITSNVVILHDDLLVQPLLWPEPVAQRQVNAPCRSEEQAEAVAAILQVVAGHRRRPLVLTADRGRGKSAALGIAAAQLAQQGKTQLLITAPSPQAAQVALNLFRQLTNAVMHDRLRFVPVDLLLQQQPDADLLMIDEAAAIPTPMLQQLLKRYSRTVFASTEHGYEGTGRGFQLRFQQHLTAQCPGWKKLHLQQPIRYQQHDPLEQLIFQSFLLQSPHVDVANADLSKITSQCYQGADWRQHPQKLAQVFAMLSLAHYQTQVKDLAALLDNPFLTVLTLETDDKVVACALLSTEGNIPDALATQIYHGGRRVQGHLLAQSLAFHLASPQLASQPLLRVMRIAVQPQLQRQGLGNRLLLQIDDYAKLQHHYIGSSFGLTAELFTFWMQAGYRAVRLGHSCDNASGEHSILMLKALTADAVTVSRLNRQFGEQLHQTLFVSYPDLTPELALLLATPASSNALSAAEMHQLWLFSQHQRPFELISHLLLRWFNQHALSLDTCIAESLCAKLWQAKSWQQLVTQTGVTGKKALIQLWANAIAEKLSAYFDRT